MENTLQHVGILGMHWGRRKAPLSNPSVDHLRVANLKKKKLHEMSNEDIRTITNRMNLENQYKALHPTKLTRGKKRLEGAMATIGTLGAGAVVLRKSYPIAKKIVTKAFLLFKASQRLRASGGNLF